MEPPSHHSESRFLPSRTIQLLGYPSFRKPPNICHQGHQLPLIYGNTPLRMSTESTDVPWHMMRRILHSSSLEGLKCETQKQAGNIFLHLSTSFKIWNGTTIDFKWLKKPCSTDRQCHSKTPSGISACSRESKLGRSVEKHFTDKNP